MARELIETHSIDYIPESERHGKVWLQGPFWFLGNLQFLTISLGFIGPSLGLSLLWTAVAGILGILIGSWFAAFHGAQGPRLGLPQMIQSRAQLGFRGVVLATAIVYVIYITSNVIGQVILSQGLNNSFGWSTGAVMAITAVVGLVIATLGHDWIHYAYRAILVFSLPLTVLVSIAVLTGHAGGGHHAATHLGFNSVAFFSELAVCSSYNLILAPYISDYTRYLPSVTKNKTVIWAVFLGSALSPIWLIPLGAWMAIHLGAADGLTGLKVAGNHFIDGLGTVSAVVSASALMAIAGLNSYGASLSLLTALDSFKRIKITKATRIAAILFSVILFYVIGISVTGKATDTINTLLTLLLYLVVPWSAINLLDFYVIRRGHYSLKDLGSPDGVYGVWNWRGLIAYALGFAAEIPFMVLPSLGNFHFTGPIAKNISGIDISWIVGLIIAGGAYWFFTRSVDPAEEVAGTPAASVTANSREGELVG